MVSGAPMTVTRDPIAVPDSTAATFSLLRELRRGRGRKQAASAAYWAYLIAIIVVGYGGSLIVTAYRALHHPPPAPAATVALRLMVLDEPEQRLDPAARRWLGGLLRAEKEAGAAVLLATHHTELAAAVADHVIVLSDGAVTAEGPPDVTLAAQS